MQSKALNQVRICLMSVYFHKQIFFFAKVMGREREITTKCNFEYAVYSSANCVQI